jgi:hypothetical protein
MFRVLAGDLDNERRKIFYLSKFSSIALHAVEIFILKLLS